MRPGQQGPGNRTTGGRGGIATVGFNEAGATRPRKRVDVLSDEAQEQALQ